MTTWQTALLDPPWEERGSGKIKRGAQKHYSLLKTQDMPGVIRGSGLWTPDENAHVYCWVTNNFLPDGLWLLNELGARYITNIAWTKKRPGIGRYFRGKHELLLFATIGRGWAVRTAPNNIESAIDTDGDGYFPDGDSIEAEHELVDGKRKHSAKPKVFYDMIESRSLGPYVEFFARSLRPGWTSWGNDEAVAAAVATLNRGNEPDSGSIAAAEPAEIGTPEMCHGEPAEIGTPEMSHTEDAEIGGLTGQLGPAQKDPGIRDVGGNVEMCHSEPAEKRRAEAMERLRDPPPPMAPPGGYGLHTGQIHAPLMSPAGFPAGPLPGGPTGHLPKADPVPPPRPPSCPHGELRSACVLCRSRR